VKRILTAALLIPIVVIALFKTPLWLFTVLVFAVAALAAHEYFGMVRAQGYKPFVFLSYLLLALAFGIFQIIATLLHGWSPHQQALGVAGMVGMLFWWGLPVITFLFPLLLLAAAMARDPLSQTLPSAAVSCRMIPYIAFTLGLLPVLRSLWSGALYLLFLMLLVWCGDIAAYYVGRALGKHKLAPRVSPGKTWEGAVASVLGAVVVGLLLFRFINPIADAFRSIHLLSATGYAYYFPRPTRIAVSFAPAPWWLVALFAVCVNVAAQLGDLVESALKRGAGVKDSGTLLPGHGGVLDRIDALLFALPVGLIFYLAGLSKYFTLA
jgi:phosphatidate cytidylyltransferase